MVVDIFWLVVGGGEWWWIVMGGGGWWWLVALFSLTQFSINIKSLTIIHS